MPRKSNLEEKILMHRGTTVPYFLRRSTRAKQISITVEYDGSVIVSLPNHHNEKYAEHFLRKRIAWVQKNVKEMEKYKDCTFLPSGRADYLKNKELARALVRECITKYNSYYNFPFCRIAIRNTKRSWGSCSLKGNLNFNYKIIYLPREFAEYIVVHELCHLYEFNHSKKFWDLVARTIPNHKAIRRELRKYLI